jgi:hypothetical protein
MMGPVQPGSEAVSETSGENQERNREIARNEADRQITGDIRVSVWAIATAGIIVVIAAAILWAWLNR